MAKRQVQILLGCDPECFLKRKRQNGSPGTFVTAHGLIKGSKLDPFEILEGAGNVQVDGCALEFGITPAHNQAEWFDRVTRVFAHLQTMVPEHIVVVSATADFGQEYFTTRVPDVAKLLGCEPDFNAWTGEVNPPPDTSAFPYMRAAGGHIHIGWTKDKDPLNESHFEDCRVVAKQMDYYLGLPSLYWDTDNKRRQLYGKAGAFRPKPYGVEYRSLSNQWLKSPSLIDYVYYAARSGMLALVQGKTAEESYENLAQEAINTNDRKKVGSGMLLCGQNPTSWNAEGRGPQWRET